MIDILFVILVCLAILAGGAGVFCFVLLAGCRREPEEPPPWRNDQIHVRLL